MKHVCVLISVADINAARKFYEDSFGLEVFQDYGRNIAFSCFRHDDGRSLCENGRFHGGFNKTSE